MEMLYEDNKYSNQEVSAKQNKSVRHKKSGPYALMYKQFQELKKVGQTF